MMFAVAFGQHRLPSVLFLRIPMRLAYYLMVLVPASQVTAALRK